MDQKPEGSARDYWSLGLSDLGRFAVAVLLSPPPACRAGAEGELPQFAGKVTLIFRFDCR